MNTRDLPAPLLHRAPRPLRVALLVVGLAGFLPRAAEAQQLSPRAYWPAPRGTTVLTLGYEYSTGDTLTEYEHHDSALRCSSGGRPMRSSPCPQRGAKHVALPSTSSVSGRSPASVTFACGWR